MTIQKRPEGQVDVFRGDVRRPYTCKMMFKNPPISTELDAHRCLCTAVADGDIDQLGKLLVESGLDPNARNGHRDTAAHQAAIDGGVAELSVLLRHGLDVNAANADGDTPLHLASRFGRSEVVKCITDALPDETLRNYKGMTPLDEATAAGRAQCVNYILKYIGDGKAQVKEDHCNAERKRFEELRRAKEVLYGRDMKCVPQVGELKDTRLFTMTGSDRARITTLLHATIVATRCIAAGMHTAAFSTEVIGSRSPAATNYRRARLDSGSTFLPSP